MKTKKILIPILTGVLFAAAANAQEDITITGSTAARKILYDRVASLFDPGFIESTGSGTTAPGTLVAGSAGTVTVSGTMTNIVGATPVTLRFSMSGSDQGMGDVNAQNPLPTVDPVTHFGGSNAIPLISMADNFPEAASPSIPSSHFTQNTNLMVLPFVFLKNPVSDMTGVTNITKEQAIMLMTSSGTVGGFPAMKPDFLGGTTNNGPVYLLGRDIGSGTRVGVFRDIGFTGTPRQWTTNAANSMVLASSLAGTANIVGTAVDGNPGDGFASGGTLVKVLMGMTTVNGIGYAGEADASGNGSSAANWLTYEGAPCTHTNVVNGTYPIWCYEHIYARSGISGNQAAIMNALVSALSNPGYQATNTAVFRPNAVALGEMKVKRGVDGGSFTTTTAAGF